jgi:hypothetical protein
MCSRSTEAISFSTWSPTTWPERAERRAVLDGAQLQGTEEFLERVAVREPREHVGLRALLGLFQRAADLAELFGGLREVGFERGCAAGGLRQFAHQAFDQPARIALDRDAIERAHLRAVVVDRGGEKLLGAGHQRRELLGHTGIGCAVRCLRVDEGAIKLAAGGGIERLPAADQRADRLLQRRRRAARVREPHREIVGRRRHTMLLHQAQCLARDGCRVVEIDLIGG